MKGQNGHSGVGRNVIFGTLTVALTVTTVTLASGDNKRSTRENQPQPSESRLIQTPVEVGRVRQVKAIFEPLWRIPLDGGDGGAGAGGDSNEGGIAGPGCPPVVRAHTDSNFGPGQYIAQAGFAQGEVAAVSFAIPAEHFPIKIDMTEMIFATSNATQQTTTRWSVMFFEGTPATGQLVDVFSSDDVILPHLVMPPGTNGTNVQFMVDPGDPEQLYLENNGSNTFSVGYRIDQHHSQTQNPCFFGPPTCCNAFPTTDTSGLASPTGNWLYGLNCGQFGCPANGGWANFQQLPGFCTPSGDWVIRVTYTPTSCPPVSGACCLPNGNCEVMFNTTCTQQGGTFQGEGTNCGQVNCPLPTGACCVGGPFGSCSIVTENECNTNGGAWVGPNTQCTPGICDPPVGACCIPATGNCVDFDEATCNGVGGIWQGAGTTCATTVCFPVGACCLPDGSCVNNQTPAECSALNGTFQGHQTTCGSVTCPLPTGACCLSNGNCFVFTQPTCASVGGSWKGMGTNCADGNGNGQADACEPPAPACPADLNDSNSVDVQDLLILLGAWGPCAGCPADLNGSNTVDVQDLLILLGAWGPCP